MAKATLQGGTLKTISDNCYIDIPGYGKINPKILPEISDSKRATYADTIVIGRSTPIKTYSHSDPRVIPMKLHFIVIDPTVDLDQNINDLRALQSVLYPRTGQPYLPPVVCNIKVGEIIPNVCAILESCTVNYPTTVVWDDDTLIPFYFATDLVWHVVYSSDLGDNFSLPNNDVILNFGA